jgi:predicted HicB family RNase H-like nuclease
MAKVNKKRRREEDTEERSKPKREPGPPRLNLGIKRKVYRKVQVAAALNDMEANEWIRAILTEAAARAVRKLGLS